MATLAAERVRHRNRRADIQAFLSERRVALVGVSRNTRDFTRVLMHELEARGYEVVPVNPAAPDIGGRPCYARVQEIQPPVQAALLVTAPAVTDQVVRDCAKAGIRQVWMHRGEGIGAVSEAAVEFCEERGMAVVAGECPLMFLPQAGFPHGLHGWIKRVVGSYPK